MTKYKVQSGFIAKQFEKPEYCIGIDHNALKEADEYEISIGESPTRYGLSFKMVKNIILKYGADRILRTRNKKLIYIIPVNELDRIDKHEKVLSEVQKSDNDILKMF